MTTRRLPALLFMVWLVGAPAALRAVVIGGLRCEYRDNPLGIDVLKPRLCWQLGDGRGTRGARGQRQTAYRVLVASTRGALARDCGDLWDSGKVASDRSVHVEYAGKPPRSRAACFWKVRVWDGAGRASSWSAPGHWTMGLLAPGDWQAKWIGLDEGSDPGRSGLRSAQWIWFPEGESFASVPVGSRFFRRVIDVPAGRRVVRARAEMTADNGFELFVNGRRAGQGDDFRATAILDAAGLLRAGANTLAVVATNVGEAPNPAGLIGALTVEFADGGALTFCTDGGWRSSSVREAGWERPGFDDARWRPARTLGAYGMGPWGAVGRGEADARRLPARYLRREFVVGKRVVNATTYVCGLGFFDLYLNGRRVSDHVMDPALSDYRKTAYYLTFDVTRRLRVGRNALGVAVGNGRFYAPRLQSPAPTMDYGYPRLLVQTEIRYADGTRSVIVSDERWRITTDGPIRANNEYDGEEYDARMAMDGWNRVGYDDGRWARARAVSAPGVALRAQMLEPMRVTEVIRPVAITQPRPGLYIVDMGQNLYGTVRLKARGRRGTEVRMVSAYSLLPNGMLKTADNRGARATDVYTFRGGGEEVWSPRFKGQGFRRVQVTGFPGTPRLDNFAGLVIHTDAPPTGSFACSNGLVNRIHGAARRGMRMFLRSAPLDPDRDERQPWLGDPARDAESEAFNYNVAAFYTKWMDDIGRSQRADGTIPDVSMNWDWGSGVEWPSVFTIIPDWYLDFYADRRVVESHYEGMKRWTLAMDGMHRRPDGTLGSRGYADWCDTYSMDGRGPDTGGTPQELVSTAYHLHNCRIMARAASRLGRTEDALRFAGLADGLAAAFNRRFLEPTTGAYGGGTQCAQTLALAFGIVPRERRDAVIRYLVNDILVTHGGHLSVGLIGMQWLLQTLTDVGRPDVAYTIVTQTTRPSWGYMIGKGATTIWERWDCDTRDPGMNSEALLIQVGGLDAWFYQTLAGIRYDPSAPGFKRVVIRPAIVGDLTWASGRYDSLYGRIASSWRRAGDRLALDVTVPANATATVFVPARSAAGVTEGGKPAAKAPGVVFMRMQSGSAVYAVGSGTYRFRSALPDVARRGGRQ